MINVKISYPKWWDEDWGGPMFLIETPGKVGVWENVKFYVHEDIRECDFWFIYDDIDKYLFDKVICPKENIIFITGEVSEYWQYPQRFLNQFAGVFTARKDLKHKNIIEEQHICTWHIKKSFSFLNELAPLNKTKNLSAIISNVVIKEGHRKRLKFIKYIKQVFGDALDWYGKNINPLADKWDGLKDYKYSIAIENSCYEGYFTEKILDCYLSYTMPIYYGCPNILDYFPRESLILIDISNYAESLDVIRNALKSNLYEKNFNYIVEARNRILNEIGIIPYLSKWVVKNNHSTKNSIKNIIWEKKHYLRKHTVKQNLYILKAFIQLRLGGYK